MIISHNLKISHPFFLIMGENILKIPLRIEDEGRRLIKNSQLLISISEKDDIRYLKGVIPEGIFTTKLTIKKWQEYQIIKHEDDFNWISLMDKLLPTADIIANEAYFVKKEEETNDITDESVENKVQLYAKFTMSKDSYDKGELKEDFELVNNYITINVQTTDELSKTYGSFKMTEVDDELDLFSWVHQLVDIRDRLLQQLEYIKRDKEKLLFENREYKIRVEEIILNNKLVMGDLVSNFAAILNSKKKRIADLQNKGDLHGLNKKMKLENEARLDNMVIDDKLLNDLPAADPQKRKQRIQTTRSAKKHKKETNEDKKTNFNDQNTGSDINSQLSNSTEADITDVSEHNEDIKDEVLSGDDNRPNLTDNVIIKTVVGSPDIKQEDSGKFAIDSINLGDQEVVNDSLTDYSDSGNDSEK